MVPKASASLVTVATPVKTTRSDQRPPNKEERGRKAPKSLQWSEKRTEDSLCYIDPLAS